MVLERIAVTGGSGLIGTAVIERLNEAGYHTISLDRDGRYRTSSEAAAEEAADEFYSVDLMDAGEVYGSLARSGADAVIHLGTITNPVCNPGYVTYGSNVMTSYHVLEAANELGMEAACLASSINVVGAGFQEQPMDVRYLPMDESHPLTPRDPYALGKHSMEVTADGFARLESNLRTISSVRFPTVETPAGLRERYAQQDRTIHGIRAAETPDRDVLFSYVALSDAADLVKRTIESDHTGHERFWAVASDTTAAVESEELSQEFYPDVERPRSLTEYESLISNDKAEEVLGWQPSVSWRDLQ